MDPTTPVDAAQPTEGQGGGDEQFNGLYDLSTAPEELRPALEEHLKKITGNVDKRFREHADYRKQWEPLEQIDGLRDVDPEHLAELIQFNQIASDPAQFQDWWNAIGDHNGWFDGDDSPDGGDGGDTPADPHVQALQQQLEELKQAIDPLREFVTSTENDRRMTEAQSAIQQKLEDLKSEHGDFNRDAVLKLAQAYPDDEDPIGRAMEDYLEITGQAQGQLVDRKDDQPAPTLSGGQADTTPQTLSFRDKKQLNSAALARLG